jgi:putative ubiquitin-RnfH superfamily antitoxin RatB of RatAB toxin-antitoxin module
MGRAESRSLQVEVAFAAAPRQVRCVTISLPEGSTLDDALQASGLADEVRQGGFECGVWGHRRAGSTPLRDGDRVECWRALTVDPMTARRQRHDAQRSQKKRPARAGRPG